MRFVCVYSYTCVCLAMHVCVYCVDGQRYSTLSWTALTAMRQWLKSNRLFLQLKLVGNLEGDKKTNRRSID